MTVVVSLSQTESYDFVVPQGTTLRETISFTDIDGTAALFSGMTITMKVRKVTRPTLSSPTPSAGAAVLTLTKNAGLYETGVDGILVIDIPASTTGTIAVGEYNYDIEIVKLNSVVLKVLRGKFVVTPASVNTYKEALLGTADWYVDARQYSGVGALLDQSPNKLHAKIGATGLAQIVPMTSEMNGLLLPGAANNTLTTPHSASFNWTSGVIDISCRARILSAAADGTFAAKESSATATGINYRFDYTSGGLIRFLAGNGTTITAANTAGIEVVLDTLTWYRATCNPSTGVIVFYKSLDGVSWTTISTHTVTAFTPQTNATSLSVGSYMGVGVINGYVAKASVKIGSTVVASVGTNVPGNTTTIYGGGGTTWTVATSTTTTNNPLFLSYSGTKYVYFPQSAGNWIGGGEFNPWTVGGDFDLRVKTGVNLTTTTLSAFCGNTNQISTGFRFGTGNTTPRLFIHWYDSGTASFRSVAANADNPIGLDPIWVRVTVDRDNGSAGNNVSFYYSQDGTTWVQIGTTVTTATVANLAYNSGLGQNFGIGSQKGDSQVNGAIGSIYQVVAYSDLTQTTKTVDFDAASYASPYASCVSLGRTYTVNRSASGRKAAVVDRPLFLFGTDDYMEVVNNALLDFGAADSFTVVVAVREHSPGSGTNSRLISKRATTGAGWEIISNRSVALQVQASVQDGVDAGGPITPARTAGALVVVTARIDRTSGLVTHFYNEVVQAPTSSLAVIDSMANAVPLAIGRISTSTNYADMEFLGAALFRRALSADEIAYVVGAFS